MTTEPNAEVRPYHPRAMPVVFRTPEGCDAWMGLPIKEAAALQRPLPDGMLRIVARGGRQDPPAGTDTGTLL